jgi:vitamin B12 transporter
MQLFRSTVFIFFFFFTAFAAAGEPHEQELPPVVVTATRVEIPHEEVTTSLTVITERDIRAKQAESVLELLRAVPGVDVVQSGSRGTATDVFIRGSDADQVLVLIDGVEVNSVTTGGFNFAHTTTENVDRVEVMRGSGGALYGSRSIGGIVNIITKSGRGAPALTISTAVGNGHTHRQAVGLTGGEGKLGYAVTAGRVESDGFHRFNDDYRNFSTSGRLDYRVTADSTVKGFFRFLKTDVGLFNNNNFQPVPDPNAREAVTQYLGKLEWEQRILPGWDYRVSGSMFKEHIKNSDDPESFSSDSRTRDRFRPEIKTGEAQTNYRRRGGGTTTFGVEYKHSGASTSGGINRSVENMGYYLQEQIKLFDSRLIVIPGIRLDDHQKFGAEWSPSLSTAYLFKETSTKLKGGYSEGFRAPTLNELFFPASFGCAAFGNPGVGPEKSWEINTGIEQALFRNRLNLGVTYFHREVKDLIGTGPTPDTTDPAFCTRAENVGDARFNGLEWLANLKLFSTVSVGAGYTYLDWRTQNGRLTRRPKDRGNLRLGYTDNGLDVNIFANIVGRRHDTDAVSGSRISKPGYFRFDLASSYLLPVKAPSIKSVSIFVKAENLLNRKYEEADGFRARPFNFLVGIQGVFGKN